LWPEVGFVEVLKDTSDDPAAAGESGRLVGTGLLNEDMPLIRYEVGDRTALADDEDKCPCGRGLPALRPVEGRLDDVIILRDGRRLGRLGPVFHTDLPIREAQIIQEALNDIRVLVVPERGYSLDVGRIIENRLRDRVGTDVCIRMETVASIPRGPNGKFRAVVSRVASVTEGAPTSDDGPPEVSSVEHKKGSERGPG
jgi:phenylacetate-CoA ligase